MNKIHYKVFRKNNGALKFLSTDTLKKVLRIHLTFTRNPILYIYHYSPVLSIILLSLYPHLAYVR